MPSRLAGTCTTPEKMKVAVIILNPTRRKRRLLKGPKEFREMRDAVHSKSKR
jgi:hypothetical protein